VLGGCKRDEKYKNNIHGKVYKSRSQGIPSALLKANDDKNGEQQYLNNNAVQCFVSPLWGIALTSEAI